MCLLLLLLLLWVCGLGFMVYGFGFRVLDVGCGV